MAIESMEGKNYRSIIANLNELDFSDYIEEVELNVGGDTAQAGMIVTYVGEVTAATPGTHNHVTLASAYNAVANLAFGFAGIILRPKVRPENYGLDDTITDGTIVLILRPTGGKAIVRTIYVDNSDDVLPGNMLSLSGTAGMVMKTNFILTTPNVAELEAALGALSEKVGVASAVAEDVANDDMIVHMRY